MKNTSLLVLLIIVCACFPNNRKMPDSIEYVHVEVEKVSQNASSFIDKIEIVPLETNDSSLLFRYGSRNIYDKNTDIFFIYAGEQTIYTFTGKGKYIANSKKMQGQGPNEYNMVLDINLNPYLKGVDLLNPYGIIYTYSPTFELLAKRKFKPEFPVNYLMALDADNYIFTYPFLWTDQEVSFVNLKTQEAKNINYEGTISGNSMAKRCFYNIDGNFYFVPIGLNYYFYRIDTIEKELVPIIYLDFGKYEVKEDGLPGRAWGKRTDSDMVRNEVTIETTERDKYLRNSNNILPLQKYFNDDYVYVYLAQTQKGFGSHYIYNRKKKEGFLIKEREPFLMYPCFGLVDNVLLSLCDADIVHEFVDKKLMSPNEINKMETLKEDDNPVILKYYLRR